MGYRFERSDDSVGAGMRRIAMEQIDKGIAELDDTGMPLAERIHQARKRCKKLRGLLRLVRPGFDGYGAENVAFRDAARLLSDVRDAGAMVETLDRVKSHFDDVLYERVMRPWRERIVAEARAIEAHDDVAERIQAMRDALVAGRDRAEAWSLGDDGSEAVAAGLEKTFARAREGMSATLTDPSAEVFHDWRKRVKYHWYHLRLLMNAEPTILPAQEAIADELADVLGDHHDLHVIRGHLKKTKHLGAKSDREALRGILKERQVSLEARAMPLGRKLFTEKPKGLSRRVAAYWQVWREEADAPI